MHPWLLRQVSLDIVSWLANVCVEDAPRCSCGKVSAIPQYVLERNASTDAVAGAVWQARPDTQLGKVEQTQDLKYNNQ